MQPSAIRHPPSAINNETEWAMTLVLMIVTALAVVFLSLLLAFYVRRITELLEATGGTPTSYLAKIRLGVRAIETETAALGPQVTRLNQGLTALAGGLGALERNLAAIVARLSG
jgi:hypothetical protein